MREKKFVTQVQCISPQGQTTPEKTLSNPWFGKGFCEPDQYKAAIERCSGGYKSCELGIDLYKDLAKILENHSAALRQWSTASQKQIVHSSEFGTTKKSWLNSIRAVEKLAESNDFIRENVQKTVIDKMTSYKNENYGKSFLQVKKIKEFEKEFKKVQRTWLDTLDKINDAKQSFHVAKRKLQIAQNAENIIKTDVGSSDDQISKAKLNVETRQKETDRCKSKYENSINEMEKAKPDYQKQMFRILESTDDFERKRLNHFNLTFNALQQAVLSEKNKWRDEIVDAFKKAIDGHNIEADIAFFNTNYGKDTKTIWPKFEDLN
ncbi:unnamed protein product [Adineta steineri]|uniref:F-BAR domain-containing protein n=1 Tax=Adineta steineri TaxID=433720 RepID=A0A815K732_9BILA|nr:unnamed protein product [Adineta steineri]CAF1391993.1 unnamed protein product [Adineta steineri]CAF3605619.1 unnamed protein product [Adineta steineri]CAF3636409.1 unnamed protein product [Adineta steineri]